MLASCALVQIVKFSEDNLKMVNRERMPSSTKNELEISRNEGAGLAIINNATFEKGTVELQIKGENNPGQSFVGFAFNVQDESTYEAIYFRPFNFKSNEKIRREHSIQYIHPPNYEWRKLRDEHEGVYEAEFTAAPDPDGWFSVKINITPSSVEVIDARNGISLLSVERLSEQKSNQIALWTGNNSKGSFRKIKLTKR